MCLVNKDERASNVSMLYYICILVNVDQPFLYFFNNVILNWPKVNAVKVPIFKLKIMFTTSIEEISLAYLLDYTWKKYGDPVIQ